MNSLRAVEAELPPGFRFQPRDEELICDYLMKRAAGCAHHTPFLIQVDLNTCEPWDIPETACVGGKSWYFYSQRDRKYATGLRTNRATLSGYWKATGKDRPVVHKGALVGMRKTLVFYVGRAPKGSKTDWIMHEFRLEWNFGPGPHPVSYVQECRQEDWVLCRVFHKNASHSHPPKQATEFGYNFSSSSPPAPVPLPPLMEPHDAVDQFQANYHHYKHHEQVPCFSFPSSQSPFQSQLDQQVSPTNITANCAGFTPNLEVICDHKSNPLNRLKMERFDSDSCLEGGSCFGDQGSWDGYPSGLELHSIWS